MSLKHLSTLGQCALATTLTVLWLWWNPLSPECGADGAECGASLAPFVRAHREPSPLPEEAVETPLVVEYGRCHTVMALAGGGPSASTSPASRCTCGWPTRTPTRSW
jgi:hypothetical protein